VILIEVGGKTAVLLSTEEIDAAENLDELVDLTRYKRTAKWLTSW
jgi:hypothetical protein